MDIRSYSERLGSFVAFMASNRVQDAATAKDALKDILSDREAGAAFDAFCASAGIDLMRTPSLSVMRVFASDHASPFAFTADDTRRAFRSQDQQELYAFALLCAITAFYPTRAALNAGERLDVEVKDVLQVVKTMIDFVKSQSTGNSPEDLETLASRFDALSDDTSSESTEKGFKLRYVRKALDALVGERLVTLNDGRYVATEALRLLAVDRINTLKSQMSQIISDFHDRIEAETQAEE